MSRLVLRLVVLPSGTDGPAWMMQGIFTFVEYRHWHGLCGIPHVDEAWFDLDDRDRVFAATLSEGRRLDNERINVLA